MITIRTATPADLPTLLQFEQGVIAAERPYDPTLKEGTINYYDLPAMIASTNVELLVAEADGRLVGSGYARLENARLYLDHAVYAYLGFMYVDPGYRGQGINNLILDALGKWALTRGVTELRLEVYPDNATAIRAYEKAGFSPILITMRRRTQ